MSIDDTQCFDPNKLKTIEIPEELHYFLTEIAKQYAIQGNYGQAMPVMFTIKHEEDIDCSEDNCQEIYWLDSIHGDYESYNEDEAQEWCKENNYYWDEDADYLGNKDANDYLERRYRRCADFFDINGQINVFFTAEAAEDYLKIDKHNLVNGRNYRTYAITPQKNYEMDTIAKLLKYIGEHN